MNSSLEMLLQLGFEQTGEWQLRFDQIYFHLERHGNERNILYAFVVDETIMYIGKSTQTLSQRMNGYKNPGSTQNTNIGNHAHIRRILEEKGRIMIYVFVQKEDVVYRGVKVNLSAGLEDNLNILLKPSWKNLGAS